MRREPRGDSPVLVFGEHVGAGLHDGVKAVFFYCVKPCHKIRSGLSFAVKVIVILFGLMPGPGDVR